MASSFLLQKRSKKRNVNNEHNNRSIGLYAEYFWWTRDWWNPPTITGTRIGIEDIFDGFITGGITAILYEDIFKKRIYKYRSSKTHNLGGLIVIASFFVISSFLFHLLKFPSFVATPIAFSLSGILILIHRRDLFYDAILTGLCLVLALIPFYILVEYFSPGFINTFYKINNLSGIKFFGIIPVEDIIFYFSSGFGVGPFYLYWKGEKLRKASKSR